MLIHTFLYFQELVFGFSPENLTIQVQTPYSLMKQQINGSRKIFGQKDLQEVELVQLQSMTKKLLTLGDNIQGKILEKMPQENYQLKRKKKYLEKEFQCTTLIQKQKHQIMEHQPLK